MRDVVRCSEPSTIGTLSFKEKGVTLTLNNPNKCVCKKVKVDGCLPIDGPICDWALLSDVKSVLIELKGSDYNRAVKQIKNTLQWFRQSTTININIGCIVMRGRIPADTARQQNFREKFIKDTGIKLIAVKSGRCINLSDI